MRHPHLYNPPACSTWPKDILRAVGVTYRQAGAKGIFGLPALQLAADAYIAAGGEASAAAREVPSMIASLSREHGDWLWGPAQEWHDRSPTQPDVEIFDAEEDARPR